jgi:hypothetical protein
MLLTGINYLLENLLFRSRSEKSNTFLCQAKREGETHFVLQEKRKTKQFGVYVLLVTCCLIAPSCEISDGSCTNCTAPAYDDSCTNCTAPASSLPTVKQPSGETKLSRRSPLEHGYVVGIGDAYRTLTPISRGTSTVPYLLSSVESHSLLSELHHVTNSELSHVVHGLSVKGQTSQHSVTKFMSFRRRDPDRVLNLLPQVTHTLLPTVSHVTTNMLSEHGFTKSPTLTVVLPVAVLHAKPSHELYSQQSTESLTSDSLISAALAANHDQTNNHHILTTFTAIAKDDPLHHLPVTHTVVQKVSTLTHDPDPVLNHDVSVTHITDNTLRTHIPEHQNVFRTHYGGFGVGIDFGGHGGGHGFYV